MPDFEVVWDGTGLLNPQDWPPQRWTPDYTFEVTTDQRLPRGKGTFVGVCAGCGRRFRIPSRRGRDGQKFCGRKCYHRHGRGRAWMKP